MKVRNDIREFIKTVPSDITLVAATKYVDSIEMKSLFNSGVTNFGENRVDAFLNKYKALKDLNISWHFIGHLQRNKAKEVINKIDYLHSLDSLKLADEIEKYRTTPLNTFVEVSINLEESKNGVPYYETEDFIKSLLKYKKINLVGLMMMTIRASDDKDNQFAKLVDLRDKIEKSLNIKIPYLSMGMSEDYLEAIKEGATHIRLGRILFGE
ncbi:MAG: YggS family pyridoxal phosphate-dependent enzyme [Bacilli bacterium]|nr:YggS family pyridoxal phosphate-dependent enzyme [Bacilli bacterium]